MQNHSMMESGLAPFRWAFFGTGAVSRKFALDLIAMGGVELTAVASRNPANARKFADEFGFKSVLADYDALSPEIVDAIYIATPAQLHEAHAEIAISKGIPVLIEKPMATNAKSIRRIITSAQAADVFCMEAMWTRFQPLMDAVKIHVQSGAIGDPIGFDARFMGANAPDAKNSLFDQSGGGGGLLHRGVYPLSIAQFLMGPIANANGLGRIGETGVDEDNTVILSHNNGALSTLRSSLRANGPETSYIYGTRGTIELRGPIWRPTGAVMYQTTPHSASPSKPRRLEAFRESGLGLKMSGLLGDLRVMTGRGSTKIRAPFAGNGYRYEAQAVMEAVTAGRKTDARMMPLDSLALLEVIDALRAGWTQKGTS